MEAQRVTVALIDHSAGFEASPERVRLADLADFSADVAATAWVDELRGGRQ